MSDNTAAVVIPTRLGGPLLADALAAVEGWPVFVVDDSDDGLDLPEGVHGVRAGGLGFAASCNLGLAAAEAAGHPLVVLLNDDARPAAGCINGLLGTWRDGVGAVGPVLIDGDGAVVSAGIRFSWWGRVRESRHVYAEDAPMDAISGACMLVRSSERFAAGYPHGMEDVALCASLRERGLVVVLTPGGAVCTWGGARCPRRIPRPHMVRWQGIFAWWTTTGARRWCWVWRWPACCEPVPALRGCGPSVERGSSDEHGLCGAGFSLEAWTAPCRAGNP